MGVIANTELIKIGEQAKSASLELRRLSGTQRNEILLTVANALLAKESYLLTENKKDVEAAIKADIKGAYIDRLTLTPSRIKSMAEGLKQVATLEDPLSEYVSTKTLPNGLTIGQKRVPMGVIGIIFEARPNVTADAFGLCLKGGSAVILRGGKEAILSNTAIVETIHDAIASLYPSEVATSFVQLITDTSRETATQMMKMNGYIDVLIPRGGAGLIKSVVENSTIPVIETGVGNCHIFVDKTADLQQATAILLNAKTQRPGVCNACETILIHEDVAERYVPFIVGALMGKGVEIHGDEKTKALIPSVVLATEEDWEAEYLDLKVAMAIVKDLDEAIRHITKYSTGHSEAILTESYQNSQRFLNEIDSAAVYVNASTRFTDGMEFGLGAEIGISTQKLHARGPMGLKELTTTKYIVYGSGQIRD